MKPERKHWIAKELLLIIGWGVLMLITMFFSTYPNSYIPFLIGILSYPLLVLLRIARWCVRTLRG